MSQESTGREVRVSRLNDEDVTNSCSRIYSGRGFANVVMVSGIDVSMGSFIAVEAQRGCFLATGDREKIERDGIFDELNCYKVENEQLKM